VGGAKVRTQAPEARILAVGLALLRCGLAFLLVVIGSYKFLAFEAEGIRPLVSSSPFAWLYQIG
jgi:uncharacterized membrane protein YkgB